MTDKAPFFPLSSINELGERQLSDFIQKCHVQQVTDIDLLINKNNHHDLLCAIFTNSPYLTRLLFRDIYFARELLTNPLDDLFTKLKTELKSELPRVTDINQLKKQLRLAKSQVALIISFADLSGQWALKKITHCLTEFAEISVSLVVRHLLHSEMVKGNLALPPHLKDKSKDELLATHDLSENTGYTVLAMGKMGGYELNYSSDIDLIVLYDNDIVQYTGRKTAQDMFIKLTQNLVKIMQERTADGYVFRTDLRLRPDPGATAIALSMEGAEIYYQSMGLNWERAAMIKARPVAGDLQAGYDFLSRIKGFIWRKHLDYAALEDIYAIKKLIHQHHGHKKMSFAGQDVKLGHGGIREIEFYAQIFQLISGGREPALQVPATCDALNALQENQKISSKDNKILQDAYVYYRTLEHRLQMINDDQTHCMPESEDDLHRITHFMGYNNQDEFKKELHFHLKAVHELFSNLLKESHQEKPDNKQNLSFPPDAYNEETLAVIKEFGYEHPKAIYDVIQTWLLGRYRACRTDRARHLLQDLVPEILVNFSKLSNPDDSLKKFDKFLSRLPSGVQLFSFINAQPWLLELLADIIGTAPNLSEQLAKRPLLLDAVLNQDFFDASFTKNDLRLQLQDHLESAKDFQDVLDIVRKWASEHKFQVGVQILRNHIDAKTAGKNLSLVADVVLDVMLSKVCHEFEHKHGILKQSEFAVFALGKLGGKELTTTSDLDLVFIYDSEHSPNFSDGKKPLTKNHYFARLSQQYINALTAMTGEGKLYEIDMRLRPSGNAGPVAVTMESFKEYQTKNAWTWEHLALTRGRIIIGNEEISKNISDIIVQAIATKGNDLEKILRDTSDMRNKLRAEFGTDNIWSIKHTKGGLVDIEFICQYLIISHSLDTPGILVPNTLDQITALKKTSLLSNKNADFLFEACDFMQNLQVILRLCLGDSSQWNTQQQEKHKVLSDMLCNRFDITSIELLAERVKETQKEVYKIFREIIELPAEKIIVPE